MDALKALGDDRAHPQQQGALGRPVTRGAGAVLLAGEHYQGRALLLVAHGGVIDPHFFAIGQVEGDAALGAGGEQVLEADVAEGAAHHHPVVAAAGAVGVEILRLHPERDQVLAGRAFGWD